MRSINISEFRANLLKYLEVANAGEVISVTSNGKLLATISPPVDQQQKAKSTLAGLAKTAKVHDVTSPTGTEWNASL